MAFIEKGIPAAEVEKSPGGGLTFGGSLFLRHRDDSLTSKTNPVTPKTILSFRWRYDWEIPRGRRVSFWGYLPVRQAGLSGNRRIDMTTFFLRHGPSAKNPLPQMQQGILIIHCWLPMMLILTNNNPIGTGTLYFYIFILTNQRIIYHSINEFTVSGFNNSYIRTCCVLNNINPSSNSSGWRKYNTRIGSCYVLIRW